MLATLPVHDGQYDGDERHVETAADLYEAGAAWGRAKVQVAVTKVQVAVTKVQVAVTKGCSRHLHASAGPAKPQHVLNVWSFPVSKIFSRYLSQTIAASMPTK